MGRRRSLASFCIPMHSSYLAIQEAKVFKNAQCHESPNEAHTYPWHRHTYQFGDERMITAQLLKCQSLEDSCFVCDFLFYCATSAESGAGTPLIPDRFPNQALILVGYYRPHECNHLRRRYSSTYRSMKLHIVNSLKRRGVSLCGEQGIVALQAFYALT